jgi:hypothetical protein
VADLASSKSVAGSGNDRELIRELAGSVDFLAEEDVALLAAVQLSTVEAWRKRGLGPPVVRMGNRYLYPRDGVAKYLRSLVRTRAVAAGSIL